MPTEAQIEQRLFVWESKCKKFEAAYDEFRAITGAHPDCKLFAPIFDVLGAYTEAVAEFVGDECEWLKWYAYECDMGKKPMSVVLPDGREFSVSSVALLAKVIAAPSQFAPSEDAQREGV